MLFMQEQYTILHNSIDNISTDKRYGDKLERQAQLLKENKE